MVEKELENVSIKIRKLRKIVKIIFRALEIILNTIK
jgi:hypothetical protein